MQILVTCDYEEAVSYYIINYQFDFCRGVGVVDIGGKGCAEPFCANIDIELRLFSVAAVQCAVCNRVALLVAVGILGVGGGDCGKAVVCAIVFPSWGQQ